MFHVDDLTDLSSSRALNTDLINEDDSPRANEALNKHRAKIQRLAQKFNVPLKESIDSCVSGNSLSQHSFQDKMAETEKQLSMIEDFDDTQKFKQHLKTISQGMVKYMPTNNHSFIHDTLPTPKKQSPRKETPTKVTTLEQVKLKYQRDLKQEVEEDMDWQTKLQMIKKNAAKEDHKPSEQIVKKKPLQVQQSSGNMNFQKILLKYNCENLNIMNEFGPEDSQESFRSDLQPYQSSSPRNFEQEEDLALQRMKQKYMNKNSPEQKKDESLRHSSEQILTESINQADYLRKSQELITSSLDDLLSTLKNKFVANPQAKAKVDYKQPAYDQINEESYQIPERDNSREDSMRISQSRQSISEIIKQSPKVLLKASQKDSIQNSSGKKLRKSQEQISFPKSSENKNIVMDQFVPLNFNKLNGQLKEQASQEIVVNIQSPQKDQVQQKSQISNDLRQETVSHHQTQSQEEVDFDNISFPTIPSQRLYTPELEYNDLTTPKIVNNTQPPKPKTKESPYKAFKSLSKLTPMKSASKVPLPKYDEIMSQGNQQLDFDEDDDLYNKEFANIQDTLKTIKEMNLNTSPQKQVKGISHEVKEHSMLDQQEIDYNLSDSDDEPDIPQHLRQSVDQFKNVKRVLKREQLDDEEISFCSSSDQTSVYEYTQNKVLNFTESRAYMPSPIKSQNNNLQFKDPELEHLMNILPLAEQRLKSGQQVNKCKEIQQSLMKVNYLVERLRYLNTIITVTLAQLQDRKRQLTLDIKKREKSLLTELQRQLPGVKELESGLQELQGKAKGWQEKKKHEEISHVVHLIKEAQQSIQHMQEKNRKEEYDGMKESIEQNQSLLDQLITLGYGDRPLIKSMQEVIHDLKHTYETKIKEINSLFVKIHQDRIILNKSEISHSLRKYFDSKSLSEYFENVIVPIIKNHKPQIITEERQFVIRLLDKEEDEPFQSIEIVQVIRKALESSFTDNQIFVSDVLSKLITDLKQQDPQLLTKLQNLRDPLFDELLIPQLASQLNPHQVQVAQILRFLEAAVKSTSLIDFRIFLATYLQPVLDKPTLLQQGLLIQTMVRFYYLQKDLILKKESPSLKVWNQARQLTEFVYEHVPDMIDELEKLLIKIDQKLIREQYKKSIDYQDEKIHELIRSINRLEELDQGKVAKKVREQVNQLKKALQEFARVSHIQIILQVCNQWMESKYYKQRIIKQKFTEYLHLLIGQIFVRVEVKCVQAEINDISIDSNNELNLILAQLQEIPSYFSNQTVTLEYLEKKFKEVRKLRELKDLFTMGLREICDRILSGQLQTFTYEEVERIIEARFETTQLRESLLKTIMKALKHK